jgi:hypothetical protein
MVQTRINQKEIETDETYYHIMPIEATIPLPLNYY